MVGSRYVLYQNGKKFNNWAVLNEGRSALECSIFINVSMVTSLNYWYQSAMIQKRDI